MKQNMWQLCVCGVIKFDNEYLMIKHSLDDGDCAGFWEMPSGKVEYGETVEDGLNREVLEETGIDISKYPRRIIGISEYNSTKDNIIKYTVQINFLIEIPSKQQSIELSKEHTDFVWASKDSEYVDAFIDKIINTI